MRTRRNAQVGTPLASRCDDGTAWQTIGSETQSFTPSVNVLTYVTANLTLAMASGIDPIDFGICVTVSDQTCDAAGDYIVAETASRQVGPTPDAAYLQLPVFINATKTYTDTPGVARGYGVVEWVDDGGKGGCARVHRRDLVDQPRSNNPRISGIGPLAWAGWSTRWNRTLQRMSAFFVTTMRKRFSESVAHTRAYLAGCRPQGCSEVST
jgi:hypothetical protein